MHKFLKISSKRQEFLNSKAESVVGRRITIQSIFPHKKEKIWSKIQTTNSLQYICKPIIYFVPQSNYELKEKWQEGDTAQMKLIAYGVIPLGKHTIHLESINQADCSIQSREGGQLVQTWNHLITMRAVDAGTIYTDEVDIYAGKLTDFVAWWSKNLYVHRQKRWQSLLK